MKKAKAISFLLAAAITGALLSACAGNSGNNAQSSQSGSGSTGSAAQETPVKWDITIPGNNGSLCNVPTFLAYELGYLAEEGINADLVSADYESKKVGLNNGTMPIVNGDFMYFPSIETGLNITVIDGLHKGCIKLEVLPDSPIETAEDLRGGTIAVDEIGGTTYQVTALWLEQNGVKAIGEDAEVTFLPFGDDNLSLEALKSGQVDLVAVWDPKASVAEKAGEVKVVLDISKDEPFASHYCCYLYASTKVLKEDPELISAILRAYRKAEDYIAKNPEAATDLILEKKYVSIEDRDLAVELVKGYGYPSEADFDTGKALDAQADVKYFAEALHGIGYLTSDPDEYIAKAFTPVDLTLGK
ncbi:ABC transporter substrate-binding protein [uncultured Oscillibacter sp.]|uniref:ABC transporter substrate-binding protein n=1 Tax=uncultured Oscillibacter sp. TaxID=876091 RepID=UPI0025FEB3FE|nr:ABC transporter substrate-binding protein [uncultured Oscillibacter sp.]